MTTPAHDENRSCWVAELPVDRPSAPLASDTDADVVVIGGGITGVSTAWHLANAASRPRVVLLEARSLASGATGRSAGQVLNGVAGVEPADAATAARLRAATMEGIAVVEKLASLSTLDAGFRRDGCLEVATTAAAAGRARRRVDEQQARGVGLRWLDADAVGLAGAHGAVLDPAAACVNPAALVRGLRDELGRAGVRVCEDTPVRRIREGPRVRIDTPRATVTAGAVVLATNAYTPSLGYFRDRILPLHSLAVATAPLDEEEWRACGEAARSGFSDDLDRIAYGVRTPGGRLLFGGGGNAAYAYRFGGSTAGVAGEDSRFAAVEKTMRAYFPSLPAARRPVERRWSGLLAITLDRVCTMGVRGEDRNVYYALGYSGHGLALGALAGKVLSDLYHGDGERWRSLPFVQRTLPWIPPEPLRWAGYQLVTGLTGRSPRRR